jgi:hypothetical protein
VNTVERQALQRFITGKRIAGLRFDEEEGAEESAEGPSLELLFDDGSVSWSCSAYSACRRGVILAAHWDGSIWHPTRRRIDEDSNDWANRGAARPS